MTGSVAFVAARSCKRRPPDSLANTLRLSVSGDGYTWTCLDCGHIEVWNADLGGSWCDRDQIVHDAFTRGTTPPGVTDPDTQVIDTGCVTARVLAMLLDETDDIEGSKLNLAVGDTDLSPPVWVHSVPQVRAWLSRVVPDIVRAALDNPEEATITEKNGPSEPPLIVVPVQAWTDREGDLWVRGTDDRLYMEGNSPGRYDYVESRWGPLTPATPTPDEVDAAFAGLDAQQRAWIPTHEHDGSGCLACPCKASLSSARLGGPCTCPPDVRSEMRPLP